MGKNIRDLLVVVVTHSPLYLDHVVAYSEREERKEGHVWIKRPERARLMRLRNLKVGKSYEGMVITVNQYGCYVDFGAERDGYVRVKVSSKYPSFLVYSTQC